MPNQSLYSKFDFTFRSDSDMLLIFYQTSSSISYLSASNKPVHRTKLLISDNLSEPNSLLESNSSLFCAI